MNVPFHFQVRGFSSRHYPIQISLEIPIFGFGIEKLIALRDGTKLFFLEIRSKPRLVTVNARPVVPSIIAMIPKSSSLAPIVGSDTRQSESERAPCNTNKGDLYSDLVQLVKQRASVSEICETAVTNVRMQLGADLVAIHLFEEVSESESAAEKLDKRWQDAAKCVHLMVCEDLQGITEIHPIDENNSRCVVGLPLQSEVGDAPRGVITAVNSCSSSSTEDFAVNLQRIAWTLQAVFDLSIAYRLKTDSIRFRLLQRASSYRDLEHFAFGITNGIASEFGFASVFFGTVQHSSIRLKCAAGLTSFSRTGPLSKQIIASMAEAMDAAQPVCVQSHLHCLESPNHAFALTEEWQGSVSDCSVASIPLLNDYQECVAVVAVQSCKGNAITQRDISTITEMAGALTATIDLLSVGNRSLLRHALDTASESFRKVRSLSLFPVAGAATLFGVLAWVAFGHMDHVIRVPCQTSPQGEVEMSSPFDGRIEEVLVRPGNKIRAGQPLIRLDDSELVLLVRKGKSRVRTAEIELSRASVAGSAAAIARAASEFDRVRAELALFETQAASASINAPFDGMVLDGDLRHRVGESVPRGTPLCTIVPNQNAELIGFVPETGRVSLEPGQSGSFITYGAPDSPISCQVKRITPRAEVADGENVFRAYFAIDETRRDAIRPGLNGIVRINTGPRRVWWIWFHRVTDTVRLQQWKFFGSSDRHES